MARHPEQLKQKAAEPAAENSAVTEQKAAEPAAENSAVTEQKAAEPAAENSAVTEQKAAEQEVVEQKPQRQDFINVVSTQKFGDRECPFTRHQFRVGVATPVPLSDAKEGSWVDSQIKAGLLQKVQ